MSILSFNINEPGQAGVFPSMIRIQTNDTLATVMGTGYLNDLHEENVPISSGMMALVSTKTTPNSPYSSSSWLDIQYSNGNWTLVSIGVAPGTIQTPTIANHIAVFYDTAGSLKDDVATAINGGNIQAGLSGTAGYLASFPSSALSGSLRIAAVANGGNYVVDISNASHGQATTYVIPDVGNANGRVLVAATATPFTSNHILTASGTGGIVSEDPGTAISAGNIQAGLSGTAGTLASFPATGSKGSFVIAAVSNTGNTNVTLSNDAHGQATVYSIPDVGNAAGQVLVGATATPFTSGHLLSASGTAGIVADSGIAASSVQSSANIKAVTTGNIGGSGAGPLTVTQAACTSSSVILCSVKSSSNACYVITIVPGSGSFTVTTNTDPGASLILDYVLFVAAQ